MKKILVTGGACAGKTTSLKMMEKYLKENNYEVYVVEEVPTYLISNGITSAKVGRMEFQELIVKTQLENEKEYEEKYGNKDNVVVIFDGSPIDCLKFIKNEELDEFLSKYDTDINKVFRNYDEIIFLDTIAKTHPELYSNENNKARLTDVDAAIERNDKLANQYKRLGKFDLIENCESFDIRDKKIIECINKVIKYELK